MMRLDNAGVVEKKFIAAGGAELAFTKDIPNLRSSAVHIIGVHLDNDRYFVRCVTLEGDVLHDELLVTYPGAFLNRALNYIAGDTFLAGLLNRGRKTGVTIRIGAAHFGGHHDFANDLTSRLCLFYRGDG